MDDEKIHLKRSFNSIPGIIKAKIMNPETVRKPKQYGEYCTVAPDGRLRMFEFDVAVMPKVCKISL
jgi:hypothetical protein